MANTQVFPPVIERIEDWPIYRMLNDRKRLVEELIEVTYQELIETHGEADTDIILETIYKERQRIRTEPWKVDPPDERSFWGSIKNKLLRNSLDKEELASSITNEALLKTIIRRYAEEIVGTFKKPTFLFARRFLTFFFKRLLNAAASRNFRRFFNSKYQVVDRLQVRGEVEKLRSLMTKGTVVLVPTHFSNLDSILIGYMMDAVLGLPSFSYGAGLNLYNTGYTAYFMNRLGAYRVDRRKKNPIYLQTLKSFSDISIRRGVNTLFFPGGTRERSGAMETRLKMGLLGTAVQAQRHNLQHGDGRKVFIVPLITGYNSVLEANFLIDQHLKQIGKEQYIVRKDDFNSFRKLIRFTWNFFAKGSKVMFSFGKPMDVLGNFVTAEGVSLDRHGRPVAMRDYFVSDHQITTDKQREQEYTRLLAERIVERFYKENIVLASHLIAYAAFNLFRYHHPKLDIFGLLRVPPEDFVFDREELLDVVGQLRAELLERAGAGKVKVADRIRDEPEAILQSGLNRLGRYHSELPLVELPDGQLMSQDLRVLFYYHNRLENYGLHQTITWPAVEAEAPVIGLSDLDLAAALYPEKM